jgi:hypothetical protein
VGPLQISGIEDGGDEMRTDGTDGALGGTIRPRRGCTVMDGWTDGRMDIMPAKMLQEYYIHCVTFAIWESNVVQIL